MGFVLYLIKNLGIDESFINEHISQLEIKYINEGISLFKCDCGKDHTHMRCILTYTILEKNQIMRYV